MIKVLVIGSEIRHEAAFAATLKLYGIDSTYVHINGEWLKLTNEVIPVKVGGETTSLRIIRLKSKSNPIRSLWTLSKKIEEIAVEFSPDVISVTQGIPLWYVGKKVAMRLKRPLLLRLWAVNAIKLLNYAKFKRSYIALFYPSLVQMISQLNLSNAIMSIETSIHRWVKMFSIRPKFKVYPSYLSLVSTKQVDDSIKALIEALKNRYVLTFAWLYNHKHPRVKIGGELSLKIAFEVARKVKEAPVVVAGTCKKRAMERLNVQALPPNLYFIGPWLDDSTLEYLYKNARLVLVPFFFTISNRFLEALNYGSAIITNSTCIELFPELKEKQYFIIEDNFRKYPDLVQSLINNNEIINSLRRSAHEAFMRYFSPKVTGDRAKKIIEWLAGF